MSAMIQSASADYKNAEAQKQDLFNEVLIKQRWTLHEFTLLALIASGSLLLVLLMLLFLQYVLPFIPLLLIALGFGIYFLIKQMRREYEYIATNGSLDIDCIIAKNKRKRVISMNPVDIEEVAPLANCQALKNRSPGMKILDCSSREKDAETWCVYGKYKDKSILTLIDGHEKILNNLKRFSPNKVKAKTTPAAV